MDHLLALAVAVPLLTAAAVSAARPLLGRRRRVLDAVAMGLPYLSNFLPLGSTPGAVSSSGTIALISFFVGIEVAAAFILIVSELLEQTLLVRQESR